MTTGIAVPRSPYKGLAAFEDSPVDALFFFGRESDREIIVANLMAARLTVLYGPSGVGKSSLLRAGVARRLRAEVDASVVVFDDWGATDPLAALATAIDGASSTVGEAVAAAAGDVYLVLDQFEEFFLYHDLREDAMAFGRELVDGVGRPGSRLNVLIAVREDMLARLDVFKAVLPGLFANQLRLEHLDRAAAAAAIVGPVEQYNRLAGTNVVVQPALVEAVLDAVAGERLDLGQGGRGVSDVPREPRIEPAYLQLVLERLWEVEQAAGSSALTVSALDELGGSAQIVRDHLDRALAPLSPSERDIAADAFDHLVTPSGTKIAHSEDDLARYAGVDLVRLSPILAALSHERILRAERRNGGRPRYEIYHDLLGDAVLAWRTRHERDRTVERERRAAERRLRRALVAAAIGIVAAATMAAVTVFALVQRSDARAAARRAEARELAARAAVELATDPQESLAIAVRAAELEPTPEVEEVLRRALLGAQLRRTWRLPRAVAVTAYTRHGAVLAAAGGRIAVYDPVSGRPVRRFVVDAPVVSLLASAGAFVVATRGSVRSISPTTSRQTIQYRSREPLLSASLLSPHAFATASATEVVVDALGRRLRFRPDVIPLEVVLGPGGRTLALVGEAPSGRIGTELYDVRSGRRIAALAQRGVITVEFDPTGAIVATGSADGTIKLWRARTGDATGTLDDEGGRVTDLDFSRDGALLAAGSSDGAARVWDVATRGRLYYFAGHTGGLTRVAFSPADDLLATTSADRTAQLWFTSGITKGRLAALLTGHHGSVTAADFADDGSTLVTGGMDGTVRHWNAAVEQRVRLVQRLPTTAVGAAYDGSAASVVGVSDGGVVRFSAARRGGGGRARSVETTTRVSAATFEPRLRIALVGGASGEAALWRRGRLTTLRHGAPITAVDVSADGARAVTAAVDGSVAVWASGGTRIRTLRHGDGIRDVAISPVDASVASAGADGVVRIWSGTDGRRVAVLRGHVGPVVSVMFSPRGDVVVTSGTDATARLWSVDGSLRHVLRGHTQPLTGAVFDRAGHRVVTTSEGSSRNALLWEVETGRRLQTLVGHFGTVSGADFSADDRWIVTAGPLSAVLWRSSTGHRLDFVRGHDGLLTGVAFAPRGYAIVTSARDGTVGVYECGLCVGVDGLAGLARRRLADARS